MSERAKKREARLKRRQFVKKLAVNALTVIVLGGVGTFFFCLVFGVFREGYIIL